MNDFRLKHPISIALEFDSERVTREKLGELMGVLNPVQAENPIPGGAVNSWTIAPSEGTWHVLSPVFPAANESMDHISAAVALLNFEGFSENFSSPVSAKNSYILNIGMGDLTLLEMVDFVRTAWLIEPAIKTLLPPSRLRRSDLIFLRKIFENQEDFGNLNLLNDCRPAISFVQLLTRGMISIRYFCGTANLNKVMFWILLWNSVIDRVLLEGVPTSAPDNMEKVFNWLRWPAEGQGPLQAARAFYLNRVRSLRQARVRSTSGASENQG